jgi:hypothetical protein
MRTLSSYPDAVTTQGISGMGFPQWGRLELAAITRDGSHPWDIVMFDANRTVAAPPSSSGHTRTTATTVSSLRSPRN